MAFSQRRSPYLHIVPRLMYKAIVVITKSQGYEGPVTTGRGSQNGTGAGGKSSFTPTKSGVAEKVLVIQKEGHTKF